MDRHDPRNMVRRGYDEIAKRYLQTRNLYKSQTHLDKLLPLLRPKTKILDIGCGAGVPICRYLIRKGHSVTGLDISKRQIELARKLVPKGRFLVKDMTKLKKKDFKVGAIVSFYAIFHAPREYHENLLKVLRSYLPKGGLFLTTMGNSDWEGTSLDFHGALMYWSHFAFKENRELIEKAGFEILDEDMDTTNNEFHPVFLAKAV